MCKPTFGFLNTVNTGDISSFDTIATDGFAACAADVYYLVLIAAPPHLALHAFLCLLPVAILNSFNLTQSGPTHVKGHTLDLVLSSGISIDKLEITNAAISEHFLIEFELSGPCSRSAPSPSHVLARSINSATASHFSDSFRLALPLSLAADLSPYTNIDELVSIFNVSCTETLDQVAPLK